MDVSPPHNDALHDVECQIRRRGNVILKPASARLYNFLPSVIPSSSKICKIPLYVFKIAKRIFSQNFSPCFGTCHLRTYYEHACQLSLQMCELQDLFYFFARTCGKSRAFGRFLVFFAVLTIASVVGSIYICLVPLRYSRWKSHIDVRDRISADSELLWLLIHCVVGHWVVVNIVFHFGNCVLLDPGRVPNSLPETVPSTFCKKCNMLRPLRAHHCSVCRRCVLRMDHHCPWINNCVGLHTHKSFYFFLAYLSLGIVYLFFAAFKDFFAHSQEVWRRYDDQLSERRPRLETCLKDTIAYVHRFVESIYVISSFVLVFAIALLIWHAYLIGRGETSVEHHQNRHLKEKMKLEKVVFRNDFDFGWKLNWLRFLRLELPKGTKLREEGKQCNHWLLLIKLVFTKIIFPTPDLPLVADGIIFETTKPSLESVLKDLSRFEIEPS